MSRKSKNLILCQFFSWNLFERDGVFYADGRHNHLNLGKHSLGTRDRVEALKRLRELDRRKALELKLTLPEPADDRREVLIADGWEKYLQHVARPDVLGGAGMSTQKRYRAVRDKHERFCAGQGIASWNKIDKRHVVAYGSFLAAKGYSDGTIYLESTLLKRVVKWFIEEEKSLPESQRIRLSLRRSEQSYTCCPSREQVKTMIRFCQDAPNLRWLANVLTALATTGMRIGELAALRWNDINLAAGIVTLPDNRHSGRHQKAGAVRKTKGRRTRRIPIHTRLRSILDVLPRREDGRVFSGPRGSHVRPNSTCKILIRDVVNVLKEKFPTPEGEVGFADCRLHSFRHAFVSQAFLDGASEGEIREWVGHTNSRIVERYRHLHIQDAKRKMDRIDFLDDAPLPGNDGMVGGAEKECVGGTDSYKQKA
ncbi:MAG: hypothetical protein JWO48_3845 [Bryobacterales bacterium]|nr:hypothetical protein [Bryobacterales bacterium]